MAITHDNNIQSFMVQHTHRFATCWKIERKDNTVYYLTNHDAELKLLDGHTYIPSGGMNASAIEKVAELKAQNKNCTGFLDDTDITHADLSAGLFREAKLTEYLVDWKYPWAGVITTNVYWISETRFTDQVWEFDIEGVERFLNVKKGRKFGRTCKWKFCDDMCGLSIGSYTSPIYTVSSVSEPTYNARTKFRLPESYGSTYDAGHGAFGYVVWVPTEDPDPDDDTYPGLNAGTSNEILLDERSGDFGQITLAEQTGYDMTNECQCYIIAGCDRLLATCRDTFDNLQRYGGCPHIQGRDRVYQTPDVPQG